MATMVFVNYPVKDVKKAAAFYEAVGFKKNPDFSNDNTSAMMWDDNFWIMLLEPEFYVQFIGAKKIADTKVYSGALTAFSLESAQAVKEFGEKARKAGGTVYAVDMGIPEDIIYGLEVLDLDGNSLEPTWMNMNHNESEA